MSIAHEDSVCLAMELLKGAMFDKFDAAFLFTWTIFCDLQLEGGSLLERIVPSKASRQLSHISPTCLT